MFFCCVGGITTGEAHEQCGQARSFNPVGVNPTPARQASHRIENFGLAGVIPKTKHRGIKTAGRKRELNG